MKLNANIESVIHDELEDIWVVNYTNGGVEEYHYKKLPKEVKNYISNCDHFADDGLTFYIKW